MFSCIFSFLLLTAKHASRLEITWSRKFFLIGKKLPRSFDGEKRGEKLANPELWLTFAVAGIFTTGGDFFTASPRLSLVGGTSLNTGAVFKAEQGRLSGVNLSTKNEWTCRLTPREVGGGSARQPLR